MADLELIVVDDGSTDDTVRELDRFSDPRLVVVRTKANQGVARAANIGIERACGEYLAALGADDVWLPTKLERQLARLGPGSGIDASYTWIQHIDVSGNRLPTIERNDLGHDPIATLLTSKQIKLACTLLVRSSAVARTALLDARLRTQEDWEYLLRLALSGVRFAGVPEPLTLVRQRSGSLSRRSMSAADMRVALSSVHRLRRAYPERISVGMMARCWLRGLSWVSTCRLRDLADSFNERITRQSAESLRRTADRASSVVSERADF